jgi:hypothetical protein
MYQSEQINELMTALSKAQGKIRPAEKNKKNPHFKSEYADLDSIWAACRHPLSEQGLSVIQSMNHKDGITYLVTTLGHTSGQWIKSEFPMASTVRPQDLGSALTYYRRYALSSMVGVTAGEDDDANAAQEGTQIAQVTQVTQVTHNSKRLSDKQIGVLLRETKGDETFWLDRYKVESMQDIPYESGKAQVDLIFNKNKEAAI